MAPLEWEVLIIINPHPNELRPTWFIYTRSFHESSLIVWTTTFIVFAVTLALDLSSNGPSGRLVPFINLLEGDVQIEESGFAPFISLLQHWWNFATERILNLSKELYGSNCLLQYQTTFFNKRLLQQLICLEYKSRRSLSTL